MRSYLSLVPISARVHKRQNRMTLVCIMIAVFLVTGIFSMADMGIRMEKVRLIKSHGNWHIMLKDASEDEVEEISHRRDVSVAAWYDVMNYDLEEDFLIGGKKAALCGAEKEFLTDIMDGLKEGDYPQNNEEIMLSENAKEILGVRIGDTISVDTPSGTSSYTISGFCGDTGYITQHDAIGAFLSRTAFEKLGKENDCQSAPAYYVQFREHTNARKVISDIREQYGFTEETMSENTAVLGLIGYSSDNYMMGLYLIAAVLFVLVLLAGVFMIAGSINSNVSERTQFFGMMRCIGASRQQVMHFVRLEALSWCKISIPVGVISGILVTWGICGILHFGVGGEFAIMPLFGVSTIGIISGVCVGILTVLIAAQSPAKRASKVSPMAAVLGNTANKGKVHGAVHFEFFKMETALGIRHAISEKKNLVLMTSSFALSMILFLGFSAFLEWGQFALKPLRPHTPDLSIVSSDYSCSVDKSLVAEVGEMPGVKRVFGRMYQGSVPVDSDQNVEKVDLISYEKYQLNWAADDLVKGELSKLEAGGDSVLVVYERSNPLTVGDKITLSGTELEVCGVLSTSPFDSTDIPTVICSEETFRKLTGESNYSIIDIQLKKHATDEEVRAIRNLAGAEYSFSDRRSTNAEVTATWIAFSLLVYGFLAIIALITVFHIINSLSMSVSARVKQYGAMRAVGMDGRQLTKMIAAEAATYAIFGSMVGCVLGLKTNQFMYEKLITAYWGDAWSMPVKQFVIILFLVFAAVAVAVYAPAKRIRNMAITETINEL